MPNPNLPEVITAGQSGHLAHTQALHAAYNRPARIAGDALKAANHTLTINDANTVVEFDTSGGGGQTRTLTIPTNASVPFPIGTLIGVFQRGIGTVNITGAAGVAVMSINEGSQTNVSRQLAGEGAEASLRKRNTDTWILVGQLFPIPSP